MLIISATNRDNSNTYKLAELYREWLTQRQISHELMDLSQLPEDFVFSALYGKMGTNPEFNKFQEIVDRHDKIIFIVPEYNGSFPGILKCFFDGLRYPGTLEGKKATFTGLSSGPLGSAVAISHLNDIMHYFSVTVLPVTPRLGFVDKDFDREHYTISNPIFLELARQQLDQFERF